MVILVYMHNIQAHTKCRGSCLTCSWFLKPIYGP